MIIIYNFKTELYYIFICFNNRTFSHLISELIIKLKQNYIII